MKAERAGQPLAPALRGERLLVVDDDPDVRDSLKRALRCAGYTVTTAVHGAEALDAMARSPVDLIVLDVLMPMVDGFDACRRLRARGDSTPILVLTVSKLDGVRAMVYTTPLAPGLAVQLAVPLATVDQEVTSVGTTLALLSVIGVGLAALAGWAVARAGLAPVGRLAASFNTMLGALQRSLTAQRQLVSDASHELRTPLTSLRLNAELLAAEPGLPEPERREVLDRVVAQVAELGQLVASVTELARDESRPGPLGEVELHTVVEASLAGARRDWAQAVFTAELEPWMVTGSTDSLQVAVRNLLDNAAKFGPPGAQVEVRLRAGELTVRDHGPGIAPADLPHVFDRFYRAPSARGVPGSGLGLSIVRQVAERHGGTVRAEAAPGGGTLIRLWLPGKAPWANPAPGAALAGSAP